jgi:hypothetical protein
MGVKKEKCVPKRPVAQAMQSNGPLGRNPNSSMNQITSTTLKSPFHIYANELHL